MNRGTPMIELEVTPEQLGWELERPTRREVNGRMA